MPDILNSLGINIANNLGWYAFSSLIALIIIYLMRPKPVERNIPSLMFFMQEKGFNKRVAFFRRLFSSLLFLLQFLALSILAFAVTMPYTTVFGSQAIESTVIVMDMSASMHTGDRFQLAVKEAKKLANGETSIILAQNRPISALENGNNEEAARVLSSLEPKDTTTNLGDAMLVAADIIGKRTGKVYVISDFINTEGPDPIVAKRILSSKGIPVEFVDVGGNASNAGIVDLILGKSNTKAIVKNYDGKAKSITLNIESSSGSKQMVKSILPKSIETYEFSTPAGTSQIQIQEKDDFDTDNRAYISAENLRKIKVLLITNAEKSHLKKALQASKDIDLSIAEPPVIPNLNYDVIIVHSVSPGLILPDFYQEVQKKVKNGTSIIFTSQDEINQTGGQLIPVEIGALQNNSKVTIQIINQFTSDIDFGTAFKYYNSTLRKGAISIAEAGGTPMIVLKDEGSGKIIYYGIMDDMSDFKTTVSYPIFWSKLINYLTKTEDLNDYNFKTGRIYTDDTGSRHYLDKAGFYNAGKKKISASLLSKEESNVGKESTTLLKEERKLTTRDSIEKRDVKFEQYLIIAAFVAILLELMYVKWRGDL